MTRVAKPLGMPLEIAFLSRTSQIYSAMKARFKEKRNKRNKIIRVGRELPFSRMDFQDWMLKELGGNPNGTCRCEYCNIPLDAMNFTVDHRDPVSQDGELGLHNLAPACGPCQKLKGKLSRKTFAWLVKALESAGRGEEAMTVADRTDLERRLKSGGMQYRGKFVKEKPKGPSIPRESRDTLFQNAPEDDF